MNRLTPLLSVTALLLLAAPAGAALSTPHSGWLWGAPEPQGHSLHSLELQGATGYAAGDFGTLLTTADGGTTWTTIRNRTFVRLRMLDMIDADSLVVGSECSLERTDDAGASFRRLPFASSARCRTLADISFPTAAVGYLLHQDGGLLKSTDGGQSFASLVGAPPGPSTSIRFTSADSGLLTTFSGDIYRTTNGGQTWTREFDGDAALSDIFGAGAEAVAVGAGGTFLVSHDGGDTWNPPPAASPDAPPRPTVAFLSVRCASPTVCLMRAEGNAVYRTEDGGATIQRVEGVSGIAVDFASATRTVLVGLGGRTLVSDDAGKTFVEQGTRLADSVALRVRVTSAAVVHVAGFNRVIARTTDGGETWANVGVPTGTYVRDVAFPTADVGYALDVDGGLFRTTNGGQTWSILDTGASEAPVALYAPSSRSVLLIGPRGMRRSTDGGQTFSRHRHREVRVRTLVNAKRAGGALLAYGPRVMVISTNGGRTWRRVVRPTQESEVAAADFVSATRGYAVETDGRVYETRDGGHTWTELYGIGGFAEFDVDFSDARNGWAVSGTLSPGRTLLRTMDAGRSWRPQVIAPGGGVSLAAVASRLGFATVDGSTEANRILFTTTGGDAGASSRLTLSGPRVVPPNRRNVRIRGRLVPARGGEPVQVAYRGVNSTRWRVARPRVARDGSFSIRRRIGRGRTVFVAQWPGDAQRASDGSVPHVVVVAREEP